MPNTETNNIRIKVRNNQAIRKNQYIEIGESIGYGLNNGKKFDTEENLNEKLVFYFKKYEPKLFYIMIGDSLHRFNFHLMIEHLSDEELAERLKDLPDNINEEKLVYYFANKFKDIATNMGQKLADSLKEHFSKIKNLPAKVVIKRWHERAMKDNYDEKLTIHVARDDEKMQKTKMRFLHTKKAKAALKKATERMIGLQPKLKDFNFDLISNLSCEQYVNEESDYFKQLHDTAFVYPSDAPPAIAPIFENNPNRLQWFEVNFKKRNIKKIKHQIAELKEIVEDPSKEFKGEIKYTPDNLLSDVIKLNEIIADSKEISDSNTEKKETKKEIPTSINIQISDSSAEISRLLKRTQSSSAVEGHSKHQGAKPQFLKISAQSDYNLTTLSPKAAARFLSFLKLYANSPKSPEEKEQALKKIDEANAILTPA